MRFSGRMVCAAVALVLIPLVTLSNIGREIAISQHLQDGEEFQLSIPKLIAFGEKLFTARWTIQEGAGRPLAKGTANGSPLSQSSTPLIFPLNFNRLSGPDANSCSGCHNLPFTGGGGDKVTDFFALAQRFDFITFDHTDAIPTMVSIDERGQFVTQQTFANERKTIGMNGSGFIEMLARPEVLRAIEANSTSPMARENALSVWMEIYRQSDEQPKGVGFLKQEETKVNDDKVKQKLRWAVQKALTHCSLQEQVACKEAAAAPTPAVTHQSPELPLRTDVGLSKMADAPWAFAHLKPISHLRTANSRKSQARKWRTSSRIDGRMACRSAASTVRFESFAVS